MKQLTLSFLLMLLPLMASADANSTRTMSNTIEGIYQVQPNSYRSYNDTKTYDKAYEIMIFKNGDGTYYVDDLFGGWYCQKAGYGKNYAMTGNIAIADDGSVSLIDSHNIGWDDSLTGLKGTYDSVNSTFSIVAEYVNNMEFYQTWIKVDDFYSGDKDAVEKDGIRYKLNNQKKEASITFKPNFYSGDLIIPEKIVHEGVDYRVTSIADSAFYLSIKLNSIQLPNSISDIGKLALYGCDGLQSLDLPNSVTNIGDSAFYECRKLTKVNLSNQLEHIGNGVFYECQSLSSIIIPSSVKSIGERAFFKCYDLTSIDIPGSVRSIGKAAFYNCESLESVNIPEGVNTIGVDAFVGCTRLTTLSLPNSLLSIPENAFKGCSSLNSLNIPNSVSTIGINAFENCI